MQYPQLFNALFHKENEGGYSVSVPALPGCFSQGENFEDAMKNIKEAINLYLEDEPEKEYHLERAREKEFVAPVEVQYA
jgi:predicted RNase H-like HicB family nuclease